MKVDLYWVFKGFDNGLVGLQHVLAKGGDYARAQGVSEAEMLEWRLAPDMNPLRYQISTAINVYWRWTSRILQIDQPAGPGDEATVADLNAAIIAARAHFATLTPEQFIGLDEQPRTLQIRGQDRTETAERLVQGSAITNFYFHLTMVYALFRQHGAPLGKADFLVGSFTF